MISGANVAYAVALAAATSKCWRKMMELSMILWRAASVRHQSFHFPADTEVARVARVAKLANFIVNECSCSGLRSLCGDNQAVIE